MSYLVYFPVAGEPRWHQIFRPFGTLGAAQDSDIHIPWPALSDAHLEYKREGEHLLLSLAEGKRPFLVNGDKQKKAILKYGDVLIVEGCLLRYQREGELSRAPEGQWFKELNSLVINLLVQRDPQKLADGLLDSLMRLCGAQKGYIFVLKEGLSRIHSSRNMKGEQEKGGFFSDSVVQKALTERQAVLITDAGDSAFSAAESVVNFRLRSVLCIPLLCEGDVLGAIYLGNDSVAGVFTQSSLQMVDVFTGMASALVRNFLEYEDARKERESLENRLEEFRFGQIIGASKNMLELYRRTEKVAATDLTVLVAGETGVGKELLSREIHRRSGRYKGPFVAINCSAIPENLLESELFGYNRGAFTGALQARKGSFQAADSGTLFLDEIGELPLAMQAKLLRAIEERKVTRLGSNTSESVDIRIIAASNRDLAREVAEGRFREDLYYRLNVVTLLLPPLRDRGDDIELVANWLLKRAAEKLGMTQPRFAKDAMPAMRLWPWPGNVRELENRITKALVMAESGQITAEDLGITQASPMTLQEAREGFSRDYVLGVLERCSGNKVEAARILGVDQRTVFRYLERERSEESMD